MGIEVYAGGNATNKQVLNDPVINVSDAGSLLAFGTDNTVWKLDKDLTNGSLISSSGPSYYFGLATKEIVETGTIIAAGYGGIKRSTDGGYTWSDVSHPEMPSAGAVARAIDYNIWDGTIIMVGTWYGEAMILMSTDDGQTWVPQDGTAMLSAGVYNLYNVFFDQGLGFFVAHGDGSNIFASLDGINWNSETTTLPNGTLSKIVRIVRGSNAWYVYLTSSSSKFYFGTSVYFMDYIKSLPVTLNSSETIHLGDASDSVVVMLNPGTNDVYVTPVGFVGSVQASTIGTLPFVDGHTLIFGGDRFYAAGYGTGLAYSFDGINWSYGDQAFWYDDSDYHAPINPGGLMYYSNASKQISANSLIK